MINNLIYQNIDYLEFKINQDIVSGLVLNSPYKYLWHNFHLEFISSYKDFSLYSLFYNNDKISTLNFFTNDKKNKKWLYLHYASQSIHKYWFDLINLFLYNFNNSKIDLFRFDYCNDFNIDYDSIDKQLIFYNSTRDKKTRSSDDMGETYSYRTYSEYALRIYNKKLDIYDKKLEYLYKDYEKYNNVTRIEFKVLRKKIKRHNLTIDNYLYICSNMGNKMVKKHFNIDMFTENLKSFNTKLILQWYKKSEIELKYKEFVKLFEYLKTTHKRKNIFNMFNTYYDNKFTTINSHYE